MIFAKSMMIMLLLRNYSEGLLRESLLTPRTTRPILLNWASVFVASLWMLSEAEKNALDALHAMNEGTL